MNDENNKPREIAITVVNRYKDKVLIPNRESEISSDNDIIPQTIEKNIRGIMTSLREEMNKPVTTLNKFITTESFMETSWLSIFKNIPVIIPRIIAIMIFLVKDIII